MSVTSYIQIIDANKAFADAHYVIKNFGNGSAWELEDHDQIQPYDYPLMYMEDSAHNTQNKEYIYGFTVWFLTRVETPSDKTGQLLYREYATAKSAMIKCAQDFIAYWVQDVNYPALAIEASANIETVKDIGKDRLTGCYVDIRFHAAFDYNNCAIPMDGVPNPPSQNVTVLLNGTLIYTLTPGGTVDITLEDQNGDIPDYTFNPTTNTIVVQTGGGSTPVDISINGTLALDDQTTDVNILVVDPDDNEKGTWDGTKQVIGYSEISVNGDFFENLSPEGTLNIPIVDSASNPVGTNTGAQVEIADSTVSNSDDSYTASVLAEGALELADTTVEVFIDSVSQGTSSFPSMTPNQVININWV